MAAEGGSERYHDLDALRAFAILVVIAFHVAHVAHGLPFDGGRPVDLGLKWFVNIAHAFQMPVFFVISGFFGAMVVARSGVPGFVRGRLRRIGIPLLVGFVFIVPLQNAVSIYGRHVRGNEPLPLNAENLLGEKLHHLWFLWYLLMFCALVLVVRALAARVPRLEPAARGLFAAAVGSRWMLPVLIGLTALMVAPSDFWIIAVPPVITPTIEPFVYFGAFFCFGWLLYVNRDLLDVLRRRPELHSAIALAGSVAMVVVLETVAEGGTARTAAHGAVVLLGALTTWTAILALLGWSHRWLSQPNARVRYVSDASYFLYLGHLPLVASMYYGLTDIGAPFAFKIVFVPLASVALLLLVYDRFVRYTVVGDVLHGARSRPGTGPPDSSAAQAARNDSASSWRKTRSARSQT